MSEGIPSQSFPSKLKSRFEFKFHDQEVIFEIDPLRCTECVGHFAEPQCVAVCPVNCIPQDTNYVETRDQLLEKYQRLVADASQK